MDSCISSIIIPDLTCSDTAYSIFDLSRFTQVESIEIGNNCFAFVKKFKIKRLDRLKSIKIGINSFTYKKNSGEYYFLKSFRILNCESLESIQIGTFGRYSNNFHNNSFVLRGIELILNI